jgi:Fe2+ or Zn2+ uptake regulation protein
MSAVSPDPGEAGEMLRARGMRSTPQRRAILSVFAGGRTEHLAADEVYARASRLVPELSRGTVYATLAEFSELGLLSAFGSAEPVRYETNLEPHAHFRCHLCLRVFDLVGGQQDPGDIRDPGFVIELVETRRKASAMNAPTTTSGFVTAFARSLSPDPRPRRCWRPGPPSRSWRAHSERCSWPRPRAA